MQIYTTSFPITEKLTKDKLIELVIEWNQGSPHNKMDNLKWDGYTRNIKFEDGNMYLWIEEIRKYNTIAIRFHHLDINNIIWTTDIVVNFDTMLFTIKLDREATVNTTEFIPKFKTPVIVNMLLERGYVGMDDELEINNHPLKIDMNNYSIIEKVINHNINYSMPVIYVTKSWGKYSLCVEELAYRLRGVAHVLVETDNKVSSILRESCNGKNAHHGSIGIYYPSLSASHKIILTREYQNRENSLIERIVRVVCRYVNQQAHDKLMTWEGVQNELLRLKFVSATEKQTRAEQEVNDVYANFDTELKSKESILEEKESIIEELNMQIEELNMRIMALHAENQGMHAKYDLVSDIPLLYYGIEDEYFEGEINDTILGALSEQVKRVRKNSRKEHIIQDVLDNNSYKNNIQNKKEEIKRVLKGTSKVNDRLLRDLKGIGFEVNKEGGHYKLIYKGDPRYMFIMSATGSDSQHGGGNLASEIINILF